MQPPLAGSDMYRQFEEDFDKLRTRLIRMGSLVEEQVEYAFRALLTGNATLADLVIERDDKVDKLDLKIDKQVQRIFALSQPVARDLRLLLAAIKINNEFERIGDYAVIIARLAHDATAQQLAELVGLERITKATYTMVKASLDAFIGSDPELAKHVLATDDIVDTLERELSAAIVARMKADPTTVESGVRLVIGLHNIERIADRATNIAENVIFLAEAHLVRHQQIQGDIAPLESEETGDESPPDDDRQ
ncbi:MAG: phosphate signaling complex protein PhoU [Chlorobi bacterium]|nr:phosphate signaling complex protein PhoU [Chlorobiota bacterium]